MLPTYAPGDWLQEESDEEYVRSLCSAGGAVCFLGRPRDLQVFELLAKKTTKKKEFH